MAERRNTIQQEVVFRTLKEMKSHPTADAVYQEVQKVHPSISRATVFRVLNRMAAEGRITKVHNGSGADGFDDRLEKHCHIRCRKCGRIEDVLMKAYPNPEQDVRDSGGFQITGHYLLFEGICGDCVRDKTIHKRKGVTYEQTHAGRGQSPN